MNNEKLIMKNLKLTKKERAARSKKWEVSEDSYPYGLELHLEDAILKKFPDLKKMKVGDKGTIHGVFKVIARRDDESSSSVTLQLQKADISKPSESFEEEFDKQF